MCSRATLLRSSHDGPEERDGSDSEELDKLHIPGIGSRSVES
jgi:hypothetical protein